MEKEVILNDPNPVPEPTANVDTNGETEESCILSSVRDVSVDNDQLRDTPLEDVAVTGTSGLSVVKTIKKAEYELLCHQHDPVRFG